MAARRRNMGPSRDLRSMVERIVALDIEKYRAKSEYDRKIEEVYTEAVDKGYDRRALKVAVKRKHESPADRSRRQETEQLADIYQAAIGDLFGRPLDDLTRRHIDEMMRAQQAASRAAERAARGEPAEEPEPEAQGEMMPEAAEPEKTADEAHEEGRQARKAGLRIVENPYHSASPLRAAWDEGWCAEDGSDGMDIPAAWKRAAKPEEKAGESEGNGDGAKPEDGTPGDPPDPPPQGEGPQPPAQG